MNWHVWYKIGDCKPTDKDIKDGEPCWYQSADWWVGPGDRKGYLILKHRDKTEEEIKELFILPEENSKAFKKLRKTKYFINFEEQFNASVVAKLRNHDIEFEPIDSDTVTVYRYADKPARLNKEYVHGSISSGDYTIGTGGDYTTLVTFRNDIAADIGSNTLRGIVVSDHSTGSSDIIFDHITAAGGWIIITSNLATGGNDAPVLTHSVAQDVLSCEEVGNFIIEKLKWVNLGLEAKASTATTRIAIIRNNVIQSSGVGPMGLRYIIINNTAKRPIKFYNNVIYFESGSGANGLLAIRLTLLLNNTAIDTAYWDANIFIENITIISTHITADSLDCMWLLYGNEADTYTLRNIAGYNVAADFASNPDSGNVTWAFINCARNSANDITVTTETNCITDLAEGDFLSITGADNNFAGIDTGSALYRAGITGLLTENVTDIISSAWPAPKSIGAYGGYVAETIDPTFYVNYRIDRGEYVSLPFFDLGKKGDNDPWLTRSNLGIGREIEFEVVGADESEFLLTDMLLTFKELGAS